MLYNSFGPGDTYSPGPGITFGCGAQCWDNGGYSFAWAFTPATTASFTRLEAVTWQIFETPATVMLSIAANDAGVPGANLETFTIPLSTMAEIRFLSLDSLLHPLLAGGQQYWLVATVADTVNEAAQLAISPTGMMGPTASRLGESPWQATGVNIGPAFRVTGDTGIPEPLSAALIGTGLIMLACSASRGNTNGRYAACRRNGSAL